VKNDGATPWFEVSVASSLISRCTTRGTCRNGGIQTGRDRQGDAQELRRDNGSTRQRWWRLCWAGSCLSEKWRSSRSSDYCVLSGKGCRGKGLGQDLWTVVEAGGRSEEDLAVGRCLKEQRGIVRTQRSSSCRVEQVCPPRRNAPPSRDIPLGAV